MPNCEKKQDMLEDLTKQIEVFTYLFDPQHHEHLLSKGELIIGCFRLKKKKKDYISHPL